MPYLQPASYELPFQSQSDTSREAAKRAEAFVGPQGADVLRWFLERGARGGTQREASEALGISRASMCAGFCSALFPDWTKGHPRPKTVSSR